MTTLTLASKFFNWFSIFPKKKYLCCVQVVQEYERAVIFRLGRLKQGGAKVGDGTQSTAVIYL